MSNQSYWTIYKNGQQISSAKTVEGLKNAAKLKEVIEFQLGADIYSPATSTVTAQISVIHNNQKISETKRDYLIRNVNVIYGHDDSLEKIIAFIRHAFYFKST